MDNSVTSEFFEAIKTPESQKELVHYDSDHFILSDGWLYEQVIAKQVAFVDKILAGA